MKVITFSTRFPAKHPKAGQPTYFVEKIMASLADCIEGWKMYDDFVLYDWHQYYNASPKNHTVRAGNRWKEGELFSPRVWSGKPYASKQIEFAPPIQIKKIWNFKMTARLWADECEYSINGQNLNAGELITLARNDGLHVLDFMDWFSNGMAADSNRKDFEGQILCWNESVNYSSIELPQSNGASQGTINSSNAVENKKRQ